MAVCLRDDQCPVGEKCVGAGIITEDNPEGYGECKPYGTGPKPKAEEEKVKVTGTCVCTGVTPPLRLTASGTGEDEDKAKKDAKNNCFDLCYTQTGWSNAEFTPEGAVEEGATCFQDNDCPSGQKCIGVEIGPEGEKPGTCQAEGAVEEGVGGGAGGAGGAGGGGGGAGAGGGGAGAGGGGAGAGGGGAGAGGGRIGEEIVSEAKLKSPLKFETPLQLINAIISAILGVVGILSVIFIIWGGYGYIMAGGSEEKIEEAKKTITYAIIGLVLSIGAYILINTVIRAIGG